jgi:hypothetical protein
MPQPSTLTPPRARLAGIVTILAGLAYLVLVGVHLTHGTFDAQLTTPSDYLNDAAFAAGLLLSIPGILALGALTRAKLATALAVVGQLLVFVGVAAGLATGHSPSWFAAVGLPGNLLALIGLTMLAWRIRRTRSVPVWVAVLLVLAVPVGLLLAEVGGTLVPALLWLVVGAWLVRPTAHRTGRQPGTAPMVSG